MNDTSLAMRLRAAILGGLLLPGAPAGAQTLLADGFTRADGLVTNEYAYYNPQAANAYRSPNWDLDSGSLFASGQAGWTGAPDVGAVSYNSVPTTNSAIFRCVSKRRDLQDVEVSLRLLNQGLSSTTRTPARAWDGAHVWLRYQGEASHYYASVNRRDNRVILKKKVPGGTSNGGTYYNLTEAVYYAVPYRAWQTVRATALNNADGSVTLALYIDGVKRAQAVDRGVGGAPLRAGGRVGLRGDNANLKFDDFIVRAYGSAADATAPLISGAGSTNVGASSAEIVWTTSEPADGRIEYGLTAELGQSSPLQAALTTGHRVVLSGLSAGRQYFYRILTRDAAGNLGSEGGHAFTTKSGSDVSAPLISASGSTNVTTSSAEIVWTTNEPADSQVEWGLSSSYGALSSLQSAAVTSHRVSLAGLRAGTQYFYRIRTRDAAGNLAVEGSHAFTTRAAVATGR